ncbi:MAG: glutamate formimidoyltransferase [Planctomycetota bacterium]|nr:glutamate formimidoyltransferase [Planctomycetota bacterium]MEC8251656.1 glutamate formimidoyltransferase [Planctomycetota bacterium]MEC9047501.1 glutamate formimidoyltransferase [Planctomycetota bacterium]
MSDLLEFVPNFSEGKDQSMVDAIVAQMTAVSGVTCLSAELDGSHNRAVVTLAGDKNAVAEAAFVGAKAAMERIDLRGHVGEHKRMGAMDVCPFVPLGDTAMAAAVATARSVGERIGAELGLPVFLYAEACMREDRRKLGNIRNKQFEGLRDLVGSDEEYAPDFGPAKLHETAGAVGVGARKFLIAYNINLQTEDVQVAKDIAKAVREKDGGFPKVQGMGFFLDDKRLAQVSMNLLDFETTSIRTVFDKVKELANAQGVEVAESELIGLAPAAAIDAALAAHIQLPNFDPAESVVEAKLG